MIKAVKYQAFDLQFKKVRFRIKQVDKLNQFFYNFILYFIFEKERNTGEICIMEKGGEAVSINIISRCLRKKCCLNNDRVDHYMTVFYGNCTVRDIGIDHNRLSGNECIYL